MMNDILIDNNGNIEIFNPLKNIPIECLGQKTRQLLSAYLNPTKVLLSEDGHHRDWRGVLYFSGLPRPYVNLLATSSDHFGELLKLWIADKENPGTLAQLQKILGIIDRWDVLDDTSEMFKHDATEYLIQKTKLEKIAAKKNATIAVPEKIEIPKLPITSESQFLTVDDMQRAQKGLPLQQYDAFILFADEDIDFATRMIDKIEGFRLKVCVKERDLLGGIDFEHDAIRNLLTNRCNRLIAILSPAFLCSDANRFIVNLAQSLGIMQRRRKIIPCLYQSCELPDVFQHMHLLNYQRSQKFNNFWEKLKISLECTTDENGPVPAISPMNVPSITLTDVDTPDAIEQTISAEFCASSPLLAPSSNNSISNNTTSTTTTTNNNNNNNTKLNDSCGTVDSLESKFLAVQHHTLPHISRSSPNSPNLLRKFLHMEAKRRTSSTFTLNTMDFALNGTQTLPMKKRKWYKKLLSPSPSSLLNGSSSGSGSGIGIGGGSVVGSNPKFGESDNEICLLSSANTMVVVKDKKKKWFRKKVASHS